MIVSDKEYTIYNPPPIVGYWQIGKTVDGGWCTRFAQYAKPSDEHIKNTEALLGWVWIDEGKSDDGN